MHLVSLRDQRCASPPPTSIVRFRAGEWIWTESSYKYTPEQIVEMGAAASFATRDQWIDDDARFALTLFTAV